LIQNQTELLGFDPQKIKFNENFSKHNFNFRVIKFLEQQQKMAEPKQILPRDLAWNSLKNFKKPVRTKIAFMDAQKLLLPVVVTYLEYFERLILFF
jgi:hypothetical protein